MNSGKPLLILIFLGLLFGVVILIYSSQLGAIAFTQRFFNASSDMNQLKNEAYHAYFGINKVRYYDRAIVEAEENGTILETLADINRCSMNSSTETLIIELVINYQTHPDNCDLFIDKRIIEPTLVYA